MRKPEGTQLAARLPGDVIKRMDALRVKLAKDATLAAMGELTRSKMLRICAIRGLEQLEREYSGK